VRSDWFRRYPPLASLVLALLIAFLVLPSALTLPNSNPSTVLEYAPIPPEDDEPPPPQAGSLSNLGLGTSSSISAGAPDVAPPIPQPGGKGAKPITKRCVGKPLRQTEDPNSPPCVPYFEGENGGATYQGVTKDEITVLIYGSAYTSDQSESEKGDTSAGETTPAGEYCDLDQPSDDQHACRDTIRGGELSSIAAIRAYARYFNDRFQTYGRHVHLYATFTTGTTPSARRADAADNWETLKPFAVVELAFFGGYNDVYAEAMTQRNVMLFGSFGQLTNAYYQRFRPNLYTFWPDVEHWADMYSTYICKKVAPYPVSHAGDDKQSSKMNGQKRKYALMYTTDASFPGLKRFRELVEPAVTKCGVEVAERVSFPTSGYATDAGGDQTYGINNVARMRSAGVTTVLWLGGMESKTTAAADAAAWYPEWIIAGDRTQDDLINGRAQNQRALASAWVVSYQLREDNFTDSPGRAAYREADPQGRQIVEFWAQVYYRHLFTMFKAIQVAGPTLNPQSVDQGQHAIPRNRSPDAFTAACYYDPGDYSCVKDSHEAWWDSNAPDPNGEIARGCWRMVRGGKRYLAGEWEGGDDVFRNPNDICNGVKGTGQNRL
jgi:hypothetical protein